MPDYTHAQRMIDALVAGETLEYKDHNGFHKSSLNHDPKANVRVEELNNPNIYRVRPVPKLIPLSREDIPPVCWIRSPNKDSMWLVTHTGTESVSYNFNSATYKWLFEEGYQHSTDRKNWRPCSKESV